MDLTYPCTWKDCQFFYPDESEVAYHIIRNHLVYGSVISDYYHHVGEDLYSLTRSGGRKADIDFDCEMKGCGKKFDNELLMNVHVAQCHLQHIANLLTRPAQFTSPVKPQNHMDQLPIPIIPNYVEERRFVQFGLKTEPVAIDGFPEISLINDEGENDPPSNDDDDDDDDEPVRKTKRLNRKRPFLESQSVDGDDEEDENENEDEEEENDYVPPAQRAYNDEIENQEDEVDEFGNLRNFVVGNQGPENMLHAHCKPTPEYIPDSQGSMDSQDYRMPPISENDTDLGIDMNFENTIQRPCSVKYFTRKGEERYVCIYGKCRESSNEEKIIEKHFRKAHLETKFTIYNNKDKERSRTEDKKYDEMNKKGLIDHSKKL